MILQIANFTIALECDATFRLAESVRAQLRRAEVPEPASTHFAVTLSTDFDEQKSLTSTRPGRRVRCRDTDALLLAVTPDFCVEVDWPRKSIRLSLLRRSADNVLSGLNSVVSLVTVSQGGIALHSSAVCRGGMGMVFTGRSGKGKSTVVSQLCPPCALIHDDFNLVYLDDGGTKVCTTPFTSTGRQGLLLPGMMLRRLFYIRKGLEFSLEPMETRDRVVALTQNAYLLPEVRSLTEKMLGNIGGIAQSVPMRTLVVPDSDSIAGHVETLFEEET